MIERASKNDNQTHAGPRRSQRGSRPQINNLAQEIVKAYMASFLRTSDERCASKVLLITGAGISVRSGIQPFRSKNGTGLWNQTLWTNANRSIFRQDPLAWYNEFWLPHFPPNYLDKQPNAAHESISSLCNLFDNICVITQNVDGLHSATSEVWNWKERLVECHGRLGLFKCIPSDDSDTSQDETDSSQDEGEILCKSSRKDSYSSKRKKRSVKLGSRRKYHRSKKSGIGNIGVCKYTLEDSIPASEVLPRQARCILTGDYLLGAKESKRKKSMKKSYHSEISVRCDNEGSRCDQNEALKASNTTSSSSSSGTMEEENDTNDIPEKSNADIGRKKRRYRRKSTQAKMMPRPQLTSPPLCPSCKRPCPPQALLFDEGYHSHSYYQFEKMENWISSASIIVFIGTSFAVNITSVALEYARDHDVPVYNFNIDGGDVLESGGRLKVENILGDVTETLPLLKTACCEELARAKHTTVS